MVIWIGYLDSILEWECVLKKLEDKIMNLKYCYELMMEMMMSEL